MNPVILHPALCKIVGQTRFSCFGIATSLREGKFWIKNNLTLLRNWPCVTFCLCVSDTVWVVRQADGFFVCFGAKPKQRVWTRDLERDRKWRRKGRSKRRQGQLTKKDGERQSTTKGRGERSALSWLSREWRSQQKSERRLLRPDELLRGWLTNARRCRHCWCLFVEVSHKIQASISLQMHRECKVSHIDFPFSCAWSWPKFVFVHLFFFSHSLGCIFCGRKEMWNILAEPTRWITGQEYYWFKEVDKYGVDHKGSITYICIYLHTYIHSFSYIFIDILI